MPRKTHKEKLKQEQRKNKISSVSFSYTATSIKPVDLTSTQSAQFLLIKKDIQKTLILGVLCIGIEILLTIYSHKLGW